MDDPFRRNSLIPRRNLEKIGFSAVANLAGGLFFFVLAILGARLPVLGIILGGISAIAGLLAIFSKDPADRKAGIILAAGGALTIFSRAGAAFFRPLAGTLLSIGGVGLFAMGIWNGIKFLKGLKS
jgi:hypothetical protein